MSKSIIHGTLTAYTKHKCRCPDCKKASADYQRAWRASRGVKPRRRVFEHGTINFYWKGCRCDDCMTANRSYRSERRAENRRRIPDSQPIETTKYRDLVEEALRAFSLDPGYLVRMTQAAARASSSPHAQLR